jgi:hypothetical protein
MVERIVPAAPEWDEFSAHHLARYLFAVQPSQGFRVLDAGSSGDSACGGSSLFGYCRSFQPELAVGRAERRSLWLKSEKRHRYFPALQPFTASSTLPPDERFFLF